MVLLHNHQRIRAAKIGDTRASMAINTAHVWFYAGQAGETLTLTADSRYVIAVGSFNNQFGGDYILRVESSTP